MEISVGLGIGDSLAQIVTAWAALAAAILGPVTGYFAARNQARRSTVSNHRQQWIDSLRDDIAQLLAVCGQVDRLRRASDETDQKARLEKVERGVTEAQHLTARISLRLNPDEDSHQELIDQLNACLKAVRGKGGSFLDERKEAIIQSRAVLKAEWNVVKAGH